MSLLEVHGYGCWRCMDVSVGGAWMCLLEGVDVSVGGAWMCLLEVHG